MSQPAPLSGLPEVSSRWDTVLDGAPRGALERALAAFLSARRWYREKSKRIESVRVGAAFSLDFAHGTARILLVDVHADDGQVSTYVVPISFATRAEPDATVMALRAGRTTGVIVDAFAVPGFTGALLDCLRHGATLKDGETAMRFFPNGIEAVVDAPLDGTTLRREQTNTSVVYGDRVVGKIVRKIEPGTSLDLEIGLLLSEAKYQNTPALLGWATIERSGAVATAALFHRFVANHGDAWKGALDAAERVIETKEAPPFLAEDPWAPGGQPLPHAMLGYAALAELLGKRVGEMHLALAASGRGQESGVVPLDRPSRERLAADARRDLDALRARVVLDPSMVPALESRIDAFVALGDDEAGIRARVHGDLHLGQTLFSGDDFAIIDFEGEPARSLEERRKRRSPLVDVAGVLRSYHYAAVTAASTSRGPHAQAWARFFHRASCNAFLRGWTLAVDGKGILPGDLRARRTLLDFFLLEKALYEVKYELDNRPAWVAIPMEGLAEIARSARTSAPPGPAVRPTGLDPRSPAVEAFAEGKATHAHALLGAHVRGGAVDFAVWAPRASGVEVIGDFDGWSGTPLALVGQTGIFAGRIEGALPNQRYKFRVTSADGRVADKTDPFARATELSPGTASVIVDETGYVWGDDSWMAARSRRLDRPMSIYEVHLGSFRRVATEANRPLSYREVAEPLARHVRSLGFTHVELLPLLEHPYEGSWGYAPTGFFSPTSRYGGAEDLRFLVDTLHRQGIGVILDWVPAHFARDAHGLVDFDGSALFERGIHATWGTGRFDLARPEVRSFLLSSAMYWLEAFHFDGLRVDALDSLLYKEHAEGVAQHPDDAGIAFVRELTNTVHLEHPDVLLAAENSSPWPGVTRSPTAGGLGFDLAWDMGFSHDMRKYLAQDPLFRSQQQSALTFRSVYAENEAYVIPLSHDDVARSHGSSLYGQMHGDPWQKLANLRLLYALAWAQPGKKLLFMGSEVAAPDAWDHAQGLDASLLQHMPHAGVARMLADLNRLYQDVHALHERDASPGGFEWIDATNAQMSVVSFLRRGAAPRDVVIAAFNFTPVPRADYRIGAPFAGHYREIFNSDARDYGGSGHGNLGGVDAVPYAWNGRPASLVVTLPPLGAVFFAPGK